MLVEMFLGFTKMIYYILSHLVVMLLTRNYINFINYIYKMENKVVVITGGSSGAGEALACRFSLRDLTL